MAGQVGYVPFDYKRHRWAGNRDWKCRLVEIDRCKLPELVRPGEILGEISAEAAEATGIPRGLALIAAGADKACEVLGSGCLEPDIGCLSYGTTATINTVHPRYIEPTRSSGNFRRRPLCRISMAVQTSAWLTWIGVLFIDRGSATADSAPSLAERGIEPQGALRPPLVNAVPPGSMGLVLQPYWSPGVRRSRALRAKGAVIGFRRRPHPGPPSTAPILEGLAYALREGRPSGAQRRSGTAMTERAGRGRRVPQPGAAMQVTADVFSACRPPRPPAATTPRGWERRS